MQVKTFRLGMDTDEDINAFIESVRLIKDGLTITQDGIMQILYTPKETPEQEAIRLNGLDKDEVVKVLTAKLAGSEGKYIDHLIQIAESQITLKDMTENETKKATQDMLDKQTNYLDTLMKEKEYMEKVLNTLREMIKKVNAGELVI